MRRILQSFAIAVSLTIASLAETAQPRVAIGDEVRTPRVPDYVVYRHFLAWVSSTHASTSEVSNTDDIRAHFADRVRLSDGQLVLLLQEADALDRDLRRQDARAEIIIKKFRKEAQMALDKTGRLPDLPTELRDLENERTALLIHHYVLVRSQLGSEVSGRLDDYLYREFAPHIKLKSLVVPNATSASGIPTF
jgi:hypothetical protein